METERMSIEDCVELEINCMKKQVEAWIIEILNIKSYEFQMICLFSILDSFAQEYSNYDKISNQQKFNKFISTYQRKWGFLNEVEPVTLFYDVKEKLKNDDYINCFMDGIIRNADFVTAKHIDNKIICDLKGNLSDKDIEKYKNKHKFTNLLYQIRNKISHEMSKKSYSQLSENDIHDIPYYIKVSNYRSNSHRLELVVPVKFMINLVEECCDNYLNECYKSQEFPFKNDLNTRKSKWCWYDL